MNKPKTIKTLTFFSILTTGLSAGLLFAYQVSINNAFVGLNDIEYIHAMQNINAAIQNPIFFLAYFGAFFLLPITAFQLRGERGQRFKLTVVAAVTYMIGTVGVTVAGNVPLNDKLAAFNVAASTAAQNAAMRANFAGPWNTLHLVRTLVAILAFGLITAAALQQSTKHEQ